MNPAAVDGAVFAAGLGSTVVVAPHPDDESIGCGGLIALLRGAALPVTVVLVSDGTQSHPQSRRWPAAERQALRVGELRAALAALGVDTAGALVELGCADGAVPGDGEPGFDSATAALAAALLQHRPATVLAPWRRDPHPDHRAASAIARTAAATLPQPPRLLEYGVWTDERGSAADRPRADEARTIRVDIAAAVGRKLRAIDCHGSQLGRVIDDDPAGFTLPASLLARCAEPVETFFECR